ncbi:helix-turn-helix transcriptional regulator [Hymenobacter sp. BT188]|uniref:helix-turn-helix transcriptional regulator n=1 Tax=Hymenobacter TaxID=89966 RepID=UPI001404C6F2|nr:MULTISPECIES: AraC family transcriptional regulator [Hymenobacter]MBC6609180.1 helix-turn-helix transcriptional regulator [Hymenobacter sp. BT188]QIL78196.1 helix-turn-helix transcriptional regulator [Hymenobacter sp. HDW8]
MLFIKHMVCARGIRVVRRELEGLGLQVLDVRLGAATVAGPAEAVDWPRVRATLAAARFALLETWHQTLVERVSEAVNRRLRQPGEVLRHRAFGEAVAQELGLSYPQLSAAFARLGTGQTLAGYLLGERLAYAQELLASSALGVGLIARRLGYSSLAHFSGQFRRLTRCSPSTYRRRLGAELLPAKTTKALNDAREGG